MTIDDDKTASTVGAKSKKPLGSLPAANRRWSLFKGALAATLAALGVWAMISMIRSKATEAPVRSASPAKQVERVDQKSRGVRHLPAQEQYRLAVQAAFGGRSPSLEAEDGSLFHYGKGQLIWTSFGAVLVSPGVNEQAFPATTGTLGVFYLKAQDGAFALDRRWPQRVVGHSMGNPPDWAISRDLSALPVIVSTAGGVWQGVRCMSTTLVELAPNGPADLVTFRTAYDNSGAMGASSGAVSITGSIANIDRGKAFEVAFTGSRRFTQSYGRVGRTYQRIDSVATSRLPEC